MPFCAFAPVFLCLSVRLDCLTVCLTDCPQPLATAVDFGNQRSKATLLEKSEQARTHPETRNPEPETPPPKLQTLLIVSLLFMYKREPDAQSNFEPRHRNSASNRAQSRREEAPVVTKAFCCVCCQIGASFSQPPPPSPSPMFTPVAHLEGPET